MQRPHETAPRRHSGFVAAFLSLLFPGLGHAYLGAYRRALGWAAPPLLLAALGVGLVVRLSIFELAGLALQDWFLSGLFVGNLVLLAYRAAAIIDAWWIARRMAPASQSSSASASAAAGLSFAGVAAVLLVMSVAHVAVARYDRLLADTTACVFVTDATDCRPAESTAPGDTSGPGASDQVVPTIPGTVGPPLESLPPSPWDGTSRLNILLIGADEQLGGHNTDTMITVSIDPTTRQVVMFTLPRDTVDVPIPPGPARNYFGSVYAGKINSWWAEVRKRSDWFGGNAKTDQPGYNGLKAIIGYLYGINIQYYVEVNFQGFKQVINALGGVTVNVQVPVVDDHFPLGTGSVTRLYIPAGMQHMDGDAALRYARSRHASSDFDRGARQQRLLVAIRQQTDISTVLPNLDTLLSAVQQSVRTDIPRSLMPQLLQVAEGIDARAIRSVIFSPPRYGTESVEQVRGYIIEPKVGRIQATVQQAFNVDPAFAETVDAIAQEGASVWVLNGSGLQGQASTIAAYLDYLGMAVTAPGQRPDARGPTTTVRAYNGAELNDPLTAATLAEVFGVTVEPVTDPLIRVDFIVTTAKSTPLLTPPPVP
jgi:LCP family protein required for cell wall assembly